MHAARLPARPAVRVRPFYAPKEGLGSAVNYNSVVVIPARSGPKERAGYLSELGVGRIPEYGSHDSLFRTPPKLHHFSELQVK